MKTTSIFSSIISYLVAIFVLCASGCSDHHGDLSKAESEEIDQYVKKIRIEDGVGQLLMVGMPADIGTVRDKGSQPLDTVLIDMQIGFAIANEYRYYDDKRLRPEEYLSKIIDFNNALQEKASQSRLGLPLLLAADFEGPGITPIKRGLLPPPSALSLGATQRAESLYEIGGMVGLELKHMGIHILLGPVLDTYNIKQANRVGLLDRSFAGAPEGVSSIASHFLAGVSKAGLIAFTKHYPSHGAVESDPHAHVIPRYLGSAKQRENELKPFKLEKEFTDGLMTSHVEVEVQNGRKIATFSPSITEELNNAGLGDKLLITDDMSSMGAILKYMEDTRTTYEDAAIQAFDSGHDILLFAHVDNNDLNSSRTTWVSPFRVTDLQRVVRKLAAHISSNEKNKTHFRESLTKILRLKAKAIKMAGGSVSELLNRDARDENRFRIRDNGKEVMNKTDRSLYELSKEVRSDGISPYTAKNVPEQVVLSAVRNGIVQIGGSQQRFNLLSQPPDSQIIFAVYEGELEKFREEFSSALPHATFLEIPTQKNTKSFKKLEDSLSKQFPACNLLIYTAVDASDSDLLTRLRRKNLIEFKRKTVVFVHGSPSSFDSELIGDITLIGNFTRHPLAFTADIEVLKGATIPKSMDNLPISIGDGGKYYNVASTQWIPAAKPDELAREFGSRKSATTESLRAEYWMIPKSFRGNAFRILGTLITLGLAAALIVFPPLWKNINDRKGVDTSFVVALLVPRNSRWIAALLATAIGLCLVISVADTLQFVDNMREATCKTHQIDWLNCKKN